MEEKTARIIFVVVALIQLIIIIWQFSMAQKACPDHHVHLNNNDEGPVVPGEDLPLERDELPWEPHPTP